MAFKKVIEAVAAKKTKAAADKKMTAKEKVTKAVDKKMASNKPVDAATQAKRDAITAKVKAGSVPTKATTGGVKPTPVMMKKIGKSSCK